MDFPKKSIEFGKVIAENIKEYVDNPTKKINLAEEVYNKSKLMPIKWYGFEESILSGNYAPYPHEVKNQAQCLIDAGINYVIARELGLKPRIFQVFEYEDDDKDLVNGEGKYDHTFVDVDVDAKKRVIIDPHMQTFGYVTYKKNKLSIRDNEVTKHTRKKFFHMHELSIDDYIKKIEYIKSPEGSIKMLETGQHLKEGSFGLFEGRLIIKYLAKENIVELHNCIFTPLISKKLFLMRLYLDENAKIKKSDIEYSIFKSVGWCDYVNKFELIKIDYEDIKEVWNLFDKAIGKRKKNRQRIKNMEISDLEKEILKKIDYDSEPLKRINKKVEERLEEIIDSDKNLLNLLISGTKYKNLAKRNKPEGSENESFYYSQKERDEFLELMLDRLQKIVYKHYDLEIKKLKRYVNIIKTRILPKRIRSSSRNISRSTEGLVTIINLRRNHPLTYNRIVDSYLYSKDFSKKKKNIKINPINLADHKKNEVLEYLKEMILKSFLLPSYQLKTNIESKKYIHHILKKINAYKVAIKNK